MSPSQGSACCASWTARQLLSHFLAFASTRDSSRLALPPNRGKGLTAPSDSFARSSGIPAGVCDARSRPSAADRAGSSSELAGLVIGRPVNPRGSSPRESKR